MLATLIVIQMTPDKSALCYFQYTTYIRIFMLAKAFEVEWLIVYEELCTLHFN